MLVEPVMITRTRQCEYKGMSIPHGDKTRMVCKKCRYAKSNLIHHAFPASTRTWGSGSHRSAYQTNNESWQKVFLELLVQTTLPRGLARVSVEAEYTWPEHYRVDKDNFRYPCSKFLGDALQAGGYLVDDNCKWDGDVGLWRFSFDEIVPRVEAGVEKMVLTIFPTLP